MGKAPGVPGTLKQQVIQNRIPGDVLVGHTFDQVGNKLHVVQVNTARSRIEFVLTSEEKENLIKALAEDPEVDAAEQARAQIWTPPTPGSG